MQSVVKKCSREMANPKPGSWKLLKEVARYLLGRERVVWKYEWQGESRYAYVASDSD